MLLARLVDVSDQVSGTRSRLAKRDLIAQLLREVEPGEVELVASYLSGAIRQRRTGVGWRSLAELPDPAPEATVGVGEVDEVLGDAAARSGPGSATARRRAVDALFARLTAPEQRYLRALLTGNVRQGALDAVMLEAVAAAADVPVGAVRRAAMFSAPTGPVAAAALSGGVPALEAFTLEVGRPVRPMLASSAPDVAGAMAEPPARVVVDEKLDGIRIQVHKAGPAVTVLSRSLDDLTARLGDVVEAVRGLPADELVLDGEALGVGDDGRPLPFQDTASSTASRAGAAAVRPFFFDLLLVDGESLLEHPLEDRLARLDQLVPEALRTPRLVTDDVAAAEAFFRDAVERGQEGVVVKRVEAPYEAGRRGAGWVKVKPRHTFDLVVLAVEWGSGRRRGMLSNIHLGARADDGFVMLGKTFKGMTDAMLAWQTRRFLELETHREGHVVHVRPEQVVEVAIDGVQRSTRYPGGVALRFARVLRYRDDKDAAEADTLASVQALR